MGVSYLICSLYVLSENHNFFKKFTFKNDICLDIENGDHFYIHNKNFNEFHKLVNKSALRRIAFRLIKPILVRNYFPSKNNLPIREVYQENLLLKTYLKKFKYTYCRYFFHQNGDLENYPTNVEININAVRVLFLLAGI